MLLSVVWEWAFQQGWRISHFRLLFLVLGSSRWFSISRDSFTRNLTRKSIPFSALKCGQIGLPRLIIGRGFSWSLFPARWWLAHTPELCTLCGSSVMKTMNSHIDNRYELTENSSLLVVMYLRSRPLYQNGKCRIMFSHSLVIHKEKTKEITTVTKRRFEYRVLISIKFWEHLHRNFSKISQILLVKKKPRLRLFFSTHFLVLGYPNETLSNNTISRDDKNKYFTVAYITCMKISDEVQTQWT